MSYLVLARKYRPRNFSEMVGQEHVVQALSNALTQQRLHHAYLFTGTRGVGKTTVSRILAKSLNCQGADGQGGITATPCGVCAACTEIDSGRFPDYTELDAASNRGVDEVQGLLEQAVYKPVQGRFKVFMIDEVHMLTNTAFNAMLKTLEEPPEYLKFVLATTDPQKVPMTVLSRCLQFNLRPMAPETVLDHLGQVLAAENVPAEPQALRLLARAARGSMRDALSLTDQAIAFGSGQLLEAGVRQMLGSVDRSYVFRLIAALAEGDGRSVVETADALRLNGLSAASTLEEMAAVLQRMAVVQAVPQMAHDASDPEASEIARLADVMPADETQLLYSICLHGRAELGLAPDEYAALTMALLRLLAFKAPAEKKTPAIADTAPAAAPRPVAPAPAPGPAPAAVAAPAPMPAPAPAPIAAPAPAPTPIAAPRPAPAPLRATAPLAAPTPAMVAAPAPRQRVEPAAAQRQPMPEAVAFDTDGDAIGMDSVEFAPLEVPPWESLPSDAAEPVARAPVQRLAPVEHSPESEPAPEPIVVARPAWTPSEPSGEPVATTPEGDRWYAAVQQLIASEAITALVRELALQSQLMHCEGDHWTLCVQRQSLNQATARERLRAALAEAGLAQQLSVEIGAVSDTPARRNAAAAQQRQRVAEEIVMNDPLVQTLMREHGARIVPGSIKPA
ncbi:MAG: DNA polymerase III subunit gamma/tau [Comamonas sp.]